MIKKTTLALSAIIFVLAISSFKTPKRAADIIPKIKLEYNRNMEALSMAIAQYNQTVNESNVTTNTIRKVHLSARLAYKKIEFLFEYLDPAGAKQRINGAPLPKTEPKVADLNIIQPKGLQILDELVFEEEPDISKIKKLTGTLQKDFASLRTYHSGIRVTHQHLFEAMRLEVVRIMTLGVTGFDTPGSLNALEEAQICLQVLENTLTYYKEIASKKEDTIYKALTVSLQNGKKLLTEAPSFEELDRLIFLTDCINPLYKDILALQRSLGIEMPIEVKKLPTAYNYNATNLFANDFLDPHYFSGLTVDNKSTHKRNLGERLFYDPILSNSLDMSCSTCHEPQEYFTDGLPKSRSNHSSGTLQRNAPSLINAVIAERYFYDLREEIFEKQIKHVVHSHEEFNSDYLSIMAKLEDSPEYKTAFDEAYPDQGISPYGIANSIAHYVASLVSFNSPFDQYVRGTSQDVSPEAKRGFNLFMGKAACGTCHFAPTFAGLVPPLYQESESEVLGVATSAENIKMDDDLGRIANSRPLDEAEIYRHSFKTTTVRNVSETAPYMHNGAYLTLDEVVDFYNKGGGLGLGFELDNQTLSDDPLELNAQEIADIIAFMHSLTDKQVTTMLPTSSY